MGPIEFSLPLNDAQSTHTPSSPRAFVPVVIGAVIFAAAAFGTGPSWKDVREDLKHPAAKRRERALEFMGEMRRDDLAMEMVPLIDDPDRDVQKEAIRAIGKTHNAAAVEPLARMLDDPKMAEYALESIADLRSLKSREYVEAYLDSDDKDLRKEAEAGVETLHGNLLQWNVRNKEREFFGHKFEVVPNDAVIEELDLTPK